MCVHRAWTVVVCIERGQTLCAWSVDRRCVHGAWTDVVGMERGQTCAWSVDRCCVHTQRSLSIFTTLGTAVLSSLHSGQFCVSIDRIKWQMIMTLNTKLLEKPRLCFLSGTHRSLFLQCQCYCQFCNSFNPVYIQI